MNTYQCAVTITVATDNPLDASEAIHAALENYEYEQPEAAHIVEWSIANTQQLPADIGFYRGISSSGSESNRR